MCCMEIPKNALKCPYCQHFQNRTTMFLHHPAFAVLGACLPMLAMLIGFSIIFDKGKSYEAYKNQITITETQLVFGETKSSKTVDVIGIIKNTSPISWKEIHFHVDFLNEMGKRIDVADEEKYDFYLPANGTSSFKVSYRMEFPRTNYVKPVIYVSTAKDARTLW